MLSRLILAFMLLFTTLSFSPVFGIVDSVKTDKSTYYDGDTIHVSGIISSELPVTSVSIVILDPARSTFVAVAPTIANSDGSFSVDIRAGGPLWSSFGSYPIRATSEDTTRETIIEYLESESAPKQVDDDAAAKPKQADADAAAAKPKQADVAAKPKQADAAAEPKQDDARPTVKPTTTEPTISPTESISNFATLKFKIANFPALDKSPQYYIDRYNSESSYKSWFDSQFPNSSIRNVVGYPPTQVANFPALDKPPQYYIDRYNSESSYKSWFDSQFPNSSIYNILGYKDPVSVPGWVRSNAEWWAAGEINDSEFLSGIEFMLENGIIMVSSTLSENLSDDKIPDWVRNNAHLWSQDLISEDEFIDSLEYLIRKGIITVN